MSTFDAVWAEIDLGNLANNLKVIRNNVNPKTKILAVVKADAYGHGLYEIAQRLFLEGVDYFGVASVDEGIDMVIKGISAPVLVLRSVLIEEMPALLDAGLIPSINCISAAKAADLYGCSKNRKVKIHIKIDTGSYGDGISSDECSDFFEDVSLMKWIEIEGIYTHLTSAYGQDANSVQNQLDSFKNVVDIARMKGLHIPLLHAASSPAIFRYKDAHFNMVRAGTALYGLPFVGDDCIFSLKPVMQLKSRIICIKELEKGCMKGYGQKCDEQRSMKIAYAAIGYADAPFLLEAKNINVLIGGKYFRVYGNAYMDHIKVDISGHNNIKAGDEVVIFGNQKNRHIGALEVANACNISKVNCESICFLGKRVNKYHMDSCIQSDAEIRELTALL